MNRKLLLIFALTMLLKYNDVNSQTSIQTPESASFEPMEAGNMVDLIISGINGFPPYSRIFEWTLFSMGYSPIIHKTDKGLKFSYNFVESGIYFLKYKMPLPLYMDSDGEIITRTFTGEFKITIP